MNPKKNSDYEPYITTTGHIRASPTPDRCVRCPHRPTIRTRSPGSTSADAIVSGASFTSTNMLLELPGWDFRQAQGVASGAEVRTVHVGGRDRSRPPTTRRTV